MSEPKIVRPQPISGFPEWLPEEKLVEERALRIIRQEFERFGFCPVETPAVERRDVLTAKGVESKEIYGLSRLAAAEGEDPTTELALHFDLTVPLARYVAQHFNRLTFPFRRYQIQKVWRGERPQAGRFREFYQADIDIVGNGALGLINDAELPLVIHGIFSRIGIGPFVIRINNRKILQGYLDHLGVPAGRTAEALRVIDALEKVGRERTVADLEGEVGLSRSPAEALVDFITGEADLRGLSAMDAGPLFAQGVEELTQVADSLSALGMPDDGWRIDLAIARGLDYYTGTVYETQLVDRPEIGSICSGGRYDNLAGTFTKQHLPGVGISIGLTRMLARLFEAGILKPGAATPAGVLVTVMDADRLPDYLAIAGALRRAGIATEVYTEARKFKQQMQYADRKGFRAAVIVGADEFAAGTVVLKDLREGTQTMPLRADLVPAVQRLLDAAD